MEKRNRESFLSIIKQAFKINKRPFPWEKPICAAICAGFPVIIGILVGQLNMGLLGGIGSFSYLYVFNEPYAARAKKIFFVAIGLSLSVAIGTLVAPYPVLVVLIVGLIGVITTFVFGTFKMPGPAAVFFVLSFIMTTSMAIDPAAAFIRSIVVLSSGVFAWIVSMAGWFFNPHGPEIKAVKEVYLALADFSEAVGSEKINDARYRTVNALRESQEILFTGYISWKNSFLFNRLFLLNDEANKLFLEMLELHSKQNIKLPKEFSEAIRKLYIGIYMKEGETISIEPLLKKVDNKYNKLLQIIYDIEAVINIPVTYIGHSIKVSKPSLKMKLTQACNKNSIVFVNALRYGAVLSIATVIAFSFPFVRSYWITLSCAAVMLGATIQSTFHRAIQRSCGTIIGLFIGIIIFQLQPKGFLLVLIMMCLTMLTELFIGKNYALAVMFITPNGLLLAENSTHIHNISYYGTARITDIIVGSMIGLIGTYIFSRHSASSRLNVLMRNLMHNQCKLILCMADNNARSGSNNHTQIIREKMQINLINLKMAYNTAVGEIPNNKELLEIMWPVVFSLEHISYLLDHCCATKGYLILSDEELAQLVFVYEIMAVAIEQNKVLKPKKLLIMEDIPKICKEINMLQEALSIKNIYI